MRTLLVLSLVLADACNKPAPKPPPPLTLAQPDDVDVLDVERHCTKNGECTLITEDCCDCTAFGSQTGVRKDKLKVITARRTPVCTAIVCPRGMSDHASCASRLAVCREGTCVPESTAAATRRLTPVETEVIAEEPTPPAAAPIVPIETIRQ